MPASYVEVQITATQELVEQLIAIFSQVGFEGFWEDGPLLKCYIRTDRWNPALADEVRATITMMQHSSSTARPLFTVRILPGKDWNETWEKTINPIHVTDRVVITPTWHEYAAQAGELVLTIDPKMSFGTGYHETTRLVLRLMEKHLRPGSRLLDIGTGTGILAIAGLKMGAASAVALDVDEWSYKNAMENARLNHVEQSVHIIHGDLSSVTTQPFDLITANIQLNVIVPMLGAMKARLGPAGVVLLSGLFVGDRDEIVKELDRVGFRVLEEIRENEWMAVAVE